LIAHGEARCARTTMQNEFLQPVRIIDVLHFLVRSATRRL